MFLFLVFPHFINVFKCTVSLFSPQLLLVFIDFFSPWIQCLDDIDHSFPLMAAFFFGVWESGTTATTHSNTLPGQSLVSNFKYIQCLLLSVSGGIADSVSKWVFRQDISPERLKEILQKRGNKEADDNVEQRDEEERHEQEKSQEDTDRTAGEDWGINTRSVC